MIQGKSAIEPTGSGDAKTAWMRTGANCMLEIGPDGALKDIVTDGKGSVVATGDASGFKIRGYMAYGYAPSADSAQSSLGYNGEYTDPVSGNYHLGNGYRAFSPTLNRFTAPDSLSPFGGGGLNTYAYCACDPINAIDPTGHMPKWLQWGLLIVGTLVSAALVVDDGWEAVLAFRAIQKFTQIAEAMEPAAEEAGIDTLAETTSRAGATAARLARVSRYKAVFHGLLAVKNIGATGLGGATIAASASEKATIAPNGHVISANWAYHFMRWAPWVASALVFTEFTRFPVSRVVSRLENQLGEERVAAATTRGFYSGYRYATQRAPMARDDIYAELSERSEHVNIHNRVSSEPSEGSDPFERVYHSSLTRTAVSRISQINRHARTAGWLSDLDAPPHPTGTGLSASTGPDPLPPASRLVHRVRVGRVPFRESYV
jgi:RHS repeat-associated protein